MYGFALVDGGRIPGDDVEAAKAGEVGNDILGDAVGESGCRGVAADVVERQHGAARLTLCGRAIVFLLIREPMFGRSEEHTSELQLLMRISYAVFCLRKKNN